MKEKRVNAEAKVVKHRLSVKKNSMKKQVMALVGETVLKTQVFPYCYQVLSTNKRDTLRSALKEHFGSSYEVSPVRTNVPEFQIYNVSSRTYVSRKDIVSCVNCESTCQIAGVCDRNTCMCYLTSTMCTHDFCCPATPFKHPSLHLDIREQGGMGKGAFATVDVPIDGVVGEYKGTLLSEAQAKARTKTSSEHMYIMAVKKSNKRGTSKSSYVYIDGEEGDQVRYINHSCNPNVRFEIWESYEDDETNNKIVRVAVVACKNIFAGQPLGVDYGWSHRNLGKFHCLCGEIDCKGVM
jgi:uncharacterized protein